MIVSFTHKFIYIAVPRTASTATRKALEAYGAAVVPYGRSPVYAYHQDTNGVHDPTVPPELEHFFKFATFRNPYPRMVSHYMMAKHSQPHRLHGLGANLSFPRFVEVALEGGLLCTQVEFVKGLRLDAKVFMETDLAKQLKALPPFVSSPIPMCVERVNASDYDGMPWYGYYDKPTIKAVREWAADDFATLGYYDAFADAVEGKPPVE